MVVLLFFILSMIKANLLILLPATLVVFFMMFIFMLYSPLATIRKRQREIDKEVLFAGRYLLVKLESGIPLYNALIDASKSYGICSKYFREIVEDIKMGTNIEDALDNAREYNASEKFKLILSELVTSLKTGADVTGSLKDILHLITQNQELEIKDYGKKLNGYVTLYLIVAGVIPSLGMTMFSVFAAMISLQITPRLIMILIFFFVLVQLFFLSLFRSIRPMVNI